MTDGLPQLLPQIRRKSLSNGRQQQNWLTRSRYRPDVLLPLVQRTQPRNTRRFSDSFVSYGHSREQQQQDTSGLNFAANTAAEEGSAPSAAAAPDAAAAGDSDDSDEEEEEDLLNPRFSPPTRRRTTKRKQKKKQDKRQQQQTSAVARAATTSTTSSGSSHSGGGSSSLQSNADQYHTATTTVGQQPPAQHPLPFARPRTLSLPSLPGLHNPPSGNNDKLHVHQPPLHQQQQQQLPPAQRQQRQQRRAPRGELDAANRGKYDQRDVIFLRDFFNELGRLQQRVAARDAFQRCLLKYKVDPLCEASFESLFGLGGDRPLTFMRLLANVYPNASPAELRALHSLAYPKVEPAHKPELPPGRADRSELIALFKLYDADDSGSIGRDELRAAMRDMSLPYQEQRAFLITFFGEDGASGGEISEISLEEFIRAFGAS